MHFHSFRNQILYMCATVKREKSVLEVLSFDSLGNELSEEVGPLNVNVEFDVMS